jgi:hypothetical protein
MIDRHFCFDKVFANSGELNTQVTHQRIFTHFIRLLEGHSLLKD